MCVRTCNNLTRRRVCLCLCLPSPSYSSAPAAEITINLGSLRPDIKAEWDELRQHDVLFLLTIRPPDSITASYMAQVRMWMRGGLAAWLPGYLLSGTP